jgi:hypothetical protein
LKKPSDHKNSGLERMPNLGYNEVEKLGKALRQFVKMVEEINQYKKTVADRKNDPKSSTNGTKDSLQSRAAV